MTSVAQAAALVVLASLVVGLVLLLRWMREPIVQARLLAKATDPAQENFFEDPNDTEPRTRLCVTLLLCVCMVVGLCRVCCL